MRESGKLRTALLDWYARNARDLPWRREVSAYRTLVSELMLQQTRVETVIPYFDRFVERFPTLQVLAEAELNEVLAAWAGLGYYRRARALHALAREAVVHGGLPRERDALRRLPGIGDYTSAAIASIAYSEPVIGVDGNVARVLSRLYAFEHDVGQASSRRALEAIGQQLTAREVASTFTQALMELGALVCTPRAARCELCPWRSDCRAYAYDRVADYPIKRAKARPREVYGVALVACAHDGAIWMGQRPASGLLAGLWEPILAEREAASACEADDARVVARERAGLAVGELVPCGTAVHVFTHRRLVLSVYRATAIQVASPDGSYACVAARHPHDPALAVSALGRRILARAHSPGPRSASEPVAADGA